MTTRKQRPAAIVSSNKYNQAGEDVIIAAINSGKKVMDTDYVLSNWQEAGLLSDSIIKTGKIVTLHIQNSRPDPADACIQLGLKTG